MGRWRHGGKGGRRHGGKGGWRHGGKGGRRHRHGRRRLESRPMLRRLTAAALAVTAACTTAPPPPPAAPAVHGFTLDEDARVLALEDRREFDPAWAAEWAAHPNTLHRERLAVALGRIGPHTFIDTDGDGVRDTGELQAGVTTL